MGENNIKTKKHIYISLSVVFITIVVFLPSVFGYIGVAYPDDITEVTGTRDYGDLDSFESNDEDIIKWTGTQEWYVYVLEVYMDIELKSNVGSDNAVWIVFEFGGTGTMSIVIAYNVGGSDTFYKEDTGGETTESYPIDDNKAVSTVTFYAYQDFSGPELYIDYLGVHYGLS